MMKTRVITAVVAIAAFILVMFFLPGVVIEVVWALLCAIGAFELLGQTGILGKKSPLIYISCFVAFIVPLMSTVCEQGSWYLPAVIFVYITAAFLFAVMDRERITFAVVTKSIFAAVVAPYMFASVLRILNLPDWGKYLVLLPWICVWVCDSAALFVGKAIGKKKLAPLVSPKKTVAGAIGGLVGGVVAAAIYVLVLRHFFACPLRIVPALIFGAVGTSIGQLGDLAFSLIKREAGIKDYGKLFPGHGGVWDRFDSIAFAASFFELFCLHIYFVI